MKKTVSSFAELANEFGIKPRERRVRPFVCRKCGEEMKHPAGTNVMVCEGTPEKPCSNTVFLKEAF